MSDRTPPRTDGLRAPVETPRPAIRRAENRRISCCRGCGPDHRINVVRVAVVLNYEDDGSIPF